MTLDQLRVFVAVAERQHMTRAAASLAIAQSAASATIASLEARYGIRLFDRVGRRIELTEAGRGFLAEARAVLARAEAAELALFELGGLARGVLTVHASQTIASYWLPRHLVAFRRAHPGISIRLAIGNTAQVAAAVHEGLAELGFIEGAVEDDGLVATTVAHDQLVLVVAPDHPWVAVPGLTLPDAARTGEWVLREPGSGTRSAFEAALAAAGVPPGRLRTVLELPSNEAVRAAVEAGMGATVISASVAAPSLEAGLLHQVRLPLPERAFQALRHQQRQPSRAAEALLARIAGRG
ncbi:LysR family transcriptional regulator [Roseomonas eburnea]|uniref:LysR family transcriptional regulator n=2 Tax=Neoroseomonas eburnea TaxID=1346889 RepID=A0A9X9XDC5_9PROT|nr:LysR substrate-binding domain-containing protein [Neoroseomonas eburnea]MBR0681711.1 LysR family transcriptional regulator [Neoroseomonas eburnea]